MMESFNRRRGPKSPKLVMVTIGFTVPFLLFTGCLGVSGGGGTESANDCTAVEFACPSGEVCVGGMPGAHECEPIAKMDGSIVPFDRNTEIKADITTEPEFQERDAGRLSASLIFQRPRSDRNPKCDSMDPADKEACIYPVSAMDETIVIRSSGLTPLSVSRVYIRGAEDCDHTKYGLDENVTTKLPNGLYDQCAFKIVSASRTPGDDGLITLQPDDDVVFNIRYTAVSIERPPPAVLVVETNAFERETIEFDLSIEVGTANINVTPSIVSFPLGTAGAMPVTEIVAVSNNGSEPLIVQSIQFQRITPAPVVEGIATEFELDSSRGQIPPFTINPGDNPVEVFIKYSPKDDGEDQVNAIFRSNAVGFESGFKVLLTTGEFASKLVVQPSPVRFNTTSGATTLTEQVTLTNAGTRTLDILNIFIQTAECQGDTECEPFTCQPPARSGEPQRCGSAYSLATGSDTSYQLRPGSSKTVNVNYTPRSAGGSDGVLRIETQKADNVEEGFLEIPLLKPGTEVKIIEVDPPVVNLNTIMAPGMGVQTIQVKNSGTLPLTIRSIAMTDAGNEGRPTDPEVTLTEGAISGTGLELMPGGTHDVEVTVTRSETDTQTLISGFLRIESDATGASEVFVSITSTPPGQ